MSISAVYEAFLTACHKPGCPFCRVEHEADVRHLDRFFYELVNDYAARVQLRASLGFCASHARLAVDEMQGKALGLAILYEDLLRIAQEQLSGKGELSHPAGKCPACVNQAEVRKWLLADLTRHILEPASREALQVSQGLCLPHLRLALEHLRAPDKRKLLVSLEQERLAALRGELAEYIRKNDYRFAGESFGAENSWRRAVKRVVGE